jgi:hypothetical protein
MVKVALGASSDSVGVMVAWARMPRVASNSEFVLSYFSPSGS